MTKIEKALSIPLSDGRLRPVIDSTHTLTQVSAAYERLESNETFGTVVLVMSDEQ